MIPSGVLLVLFVAAVLAVPFAAKAKTRAAQARWENAIIGAGVLIITLSSVANVVGTLS